MTAITVGNFMGEERTMKLITVSVCALLAVLWTWSFAFAAGDAAMGKFLFDNPTFAGGTAGRSCSSCHPDGKNAAKEIGRASCRERV